MSCYSLKLLSYSLKLLSFSLFFWEWTNNNKYNLATEKKFGFYRFGCCITFIWKKKIVEYSISITILWPRLSIARACSSRKRFLTDAEKAYNTERKMLFRSRKKAVSSENIGDLQKIAGEIVNELKWNKCKQFF